MLENHTAAAKVKILPGPGLDLRRYAVRSPSALRKTNVQRTSWGAVLLTSLAGIPALAAQTRIPERRAAVGQVVPDLAQRRGGTQELDRNRFQSAPPADSEMAPDPEPVVPATL